MSGMMVKLREYEQMGIDTIMVIDPESESIFQFSGGGLNRIEGTLQQLAGSKCMIDWVEVHELLD
jgi:hypothetical protein